jgi:uncharacterized protein
MAVTVLVWALAVIGGLAVLYVAVLFAVAIGSVRPPRVPAWISPAMMGEPEERIEFESLDGTRLVGWWVPGGDRTVVLAHGYLMNRCEFVPFVTRLRATGYSCLFFDFRGHGKSGAGKVTFGATEWQDVAAAVREARRRVEGPVVVWGGSMGAVAAIRAAGREPGSIAALVLDCPFGRLDEAARGWWAYLGNGRLAPFLAPVVWIGNWITGQRADRFDPTQEWEAVGEAPALLLFGAQDPLVPSAAIERHRQAAPAARVVVFETSGHSEARFHEPERYVDEVFGFLAGLSPTEGPLRLDQTVEQPRQ